MQRAGVDAAAVSTFAQAAGLLGAQVLECAHAELISTIESLVPDGWNLAATKEAIAAFPPLEAMVGEHDGVPGVTVSLGAYGIAATGTVAIVEPHYTDRLLTLLCERHVVLLPAGAFYTDLHESMPALRRLIGRERRYVTYVSGPSRTSDIERVLTIGVHGPRELVTILVEGWQPDAD
jgi:L-lactate dehydrogenase complex protein LldG